MWVIFYIISFCFCTQSLLAEQKVNNQALGKIIVEINIEGFTNNYKLKVPIALDNSLGNSVIGASLPTACPHCTTQSIAKYSYVLTADKIGKNKYKLKLSMDAVFDDGETFTIKKEFVIRGGQKIDRRINNKVQILAHYSLEPDNGEK